MNLTKIFDIAKWLLMRVGILYLLWFFIAPHVIDFKAIDERVKVRRLNDYRPDFTALVEYHQDGIPISQRDAQAYVRYFDLITNYVNDDPVGRYLLGFAELSSNHPTKGIEYLGQVSNQVPVLFWPDYNLGVYYYKNGDYEKAANYLNKAINAPVNVAMKMMVDSIIYRQIFANKAFKSSLVKSMYHARQDAFVLLVATLDHLEANQPMMSLSLKMITDAPDQATAAMYYYAGIAAFKLKDVNKAVILFEKSIALDDKKPWSYFWLAKIFDLAGDQEKTKEYLKAFTVLKENQPALLPYDQQIQYRIF